MDGVGGSLRENLEIFMINILNSIKDFYEYDYDKFYLWMNENYDMSKGFEDIFEIYCEYFMIMFERIGFEIENYELGMNSVDGVDLVGSEVMLHGIKNWYNSIKEKVDLDCSSVLMDVLGWRKD